jgi:FMNH2-dependent dimethyl sulfone monooxygenase
MPVINITSADQSVSDSTTQGAIATSPTDYPDSPLSQALKQPVLLGLFLPIHHGGWSASTLPRSTDWSFDYNAKLTQTAETLGFDFSEIDALYLEQIQDQVKKYHFEGAIAPLIL